MARSRTTDEFTKPTSTIIGRGFTIETARFTCEDSESMRVDGTILGDIEVKDVVNVSDTGVVDGNIIAGFVRIAGRVTGNIHCNNALHLTSTANVLGDVNAASLIIDGGAVLLGRCQTKPSAEGEQMKLTGS